MLAYSEIPKEKEVAESVKKLIPILATIKA